MKLNAKFENKKILIVSAWEPEQHTLKQKFGSNCAVDFLLTGIGSIRSTHKVTKALMQNQYDLVLFCGTAGAYNSAVPLHSVYACQKVHWSDGGVLLESSYVPPHQNKTEMIENTLKLQHKIPEATALCLPSITISENLAQICSQFATLEHLELFGLALACQEVKVPWIGILSVANIVHPKAHLQWKEHHLIASQQAQEFTQDFLTQIDF